MFNNTTAVTCTTSLNKSYKKKKKNYVSEVAWGDQYITFNVIIVTRMTLTPSTVIA